jgi:hypothetical protein
MVHIDEVKEGDVLVGKNYGCFGKHIQFWFVRVVRKTPKTILVDYLETRTVASSQEDMWVTNTTIMPAEPYRTNGNLKQRRIRCSRDTGKLQSYEMWDGLSRTNKFDSYS